MINNFQLQSNHSNFIEKILFFLYSGHLDIMNILIENGANVNARMRNGATPLILAAIGGELHDKKMFVF